MKADQYVRFEGLEDEKLVLLLQKGDKDSFSVLSDRYAAALRRRAGRYAGIAGVEVDDFLQEGLLALYRAAKGYHPDGQVRFRTYATACINNSMSAAIKLHMKQQSRKSPLAIEQLDREKSCFALPEQFDLESESSDQLIERIGAELSEFERKVLRLYLHGYSYKQISQVLSTVTKSVDNALQRVRRKLRLQL